MRDIPRPNQIYRHFKGNLYRVITMAQHSETGEGMVVYQALYGEYLVYVRSLTEFMSPVDSVKYPDADQANRFELLTEMIGQETAQAVQGQAMQVQTARIQPPQTQPVTARPGQARTKADRSEAISESDRMRPQMEQPEPEPHLTRPVVRVNYDRKLSASAESVITQAEEKKLMHRKEQEASEEKERTVSAPADAAEEEGISLDPLLMKFLDADTYEEKLNLLVALHPRLTDSMINTMAVSLDVEVNDGKIEDRYEALKTCLVTLERYECNRLR